MSAKNKDHWLHAAQLPCKAVHHYPYHNGRFVNGKVVFTTDLRDVIVSATDTHGAIVRRKGCMRYFAPFEELNQVS